MKTCYIKLDKLNNIRISIHAQKRFKERFEINDINDMRNISLEAFNKGIRYSNIKDPQLKKRLKREVNSKAFKVYYKNIIFLFNMITNEVITVYKWEEKHEK